MRRAADLGCHPDRCPAAEPPAVSSLHLRLQRRDLDELAAIQQQLFAGQNRKLGEVNFAAKPGDRNRPQSSRKAGKSACQKQTPGEPNLASILAEPNRLQPLPRVRKNRRAEPQDAGSSGLNCLRRHCWKQNDWILNYFSKSWPDFGSSLLR